MNNLPDSSNLIEHEHLPLIVNPSHAHLPSEFNTDSTFHYHSSPSSSPTYTINVWSSPNALTIASDLVATENFKAQAQLNSPSVFICHQVSPLKKNKSRKENLDHSVSEKFILKFNSYRGNEELKKQGAEMILATRVLAGLEDHSNNCDIPSARKNFAILAGLDDRRLKLAAMEGLIELLNKDEVSEETGFDLVSLAIYFMKHMDRELLQTQLTDVQIKICKIYGLITELIIRHYGKKHLGAITKELKEQLLNTAESLGKLNVQSDSSLHFTIEFALEGIKRLQDDHQEIFEFGELIVSILVTFVTAFTEPKDLINQLEQTFAKFDFKTKSGWYDVALIFNELVKEALDSPQKLLLLQAFTMKIHKELDWKFLFNVLDKYAHLAVSSKDATIRQCIVLGYPTNSFMIPGLIQLMDTKEFWRKPDFKVMIKLGAPSIKNHNLVIRHFGYRNLIWISTHLSDASLRVKIKKRLIDLFNKETHLEIKEELTAYLPKDKNKFDKWANEQGSYALKTPIKKKARIEKNLERSIQEKGTQLKVNKKKDNKEEEENFTAPLNETAELTEKVTKKVILPNFSPKRRNSEQISPSLLPTIQFAKSRRNSTVTQPIPLTKQN